MASSLRAFQTEIDQIHAKTAAEQLRTAAATATATDKKAKGKDVADVPKAEPTSPTVTQDDDEDLGVVQVCNQG
jgi:hypothetical protein